MCIRDRIDATDPEKIYVRNLRTAIPEAFRFRVAIPSEMLAFVDCRYEIAGQPTQLYRPPISTSWSNAAIQIDSSHIVSELTIYLKRNADSWSIGSSATGINLYSFLPIRDENISWLENMHEGIPLDKNPRDKPHPLETANSNGNENSPPSISDILSAAIAAEEAGHIFGIQYDTRSFDKSEEILLVEIKGNGDKKDHVIKFVVTSNPDGNGTISKDEGTRFQQRIMQRIQPSVDP